MEYNKQVNLINKEIKNNLMTINHPNLKKDINQYQNNKKTLKRMTVHNSAKIIVFIFKIGQIQRTLNMKSIQMMTKISSLKIVQIQKL